MSNPDDATPAGTVVSLNSLKPAVFFLKGFNGNFRMSDTSILKMKSLKYPFILLFIVFSCVSENIEARSDCRDQRLKDREKKADVVLTGTVKRLYGVQEGQLYTAEVQVKRVIKGTHIGGGESLLVEGFGNSDVCDSTVKVRDSKIFLLNQLRTGRFRLNSSVLHVNIPNLDEITAAIKGQEYRRRPRIEEVPCEKKFCPFNGDCYMEQDLPQCRCPLSCAHPYSPVCASDGTTYSTECQMRADTCRRQKRRIYVKHEGACLWSAF